MFIQPILIAICLILMGYLSVHLLILNSRLREKARNARMRAAVDWTRPPSRRRPKSRISDFLKI